MHRLLSFRLVLLLLVALACVQSVAMQSAAGQEARDEVTTPPKKRAAAPSIASIDKVMDDFVQEKKIAGAVTLVAHKGKIVHLGAVGWSDIEKDKPMKRSSLFAIASMTKPITATAVMVLVEEGKIELDDPVSKYIPDFGSVKLTDGSSPEREITIRDCLTHTSGLVGKQTFETSLEEAVAELAKRPLAFQPGTKWQYSPGLNVAGRIVEIVSGQPLGDFLQERVFTPCQMNSTTFFPDEKTRRMIATIYQPGETPSSLVPYANHISDPHAVTAPNPSGGLFSSARDLFRFYQMILAKGTFRQQRVLEKETVERMVSPQTADLETGFTPGNCWALGWCVVHQPQGVTEMLSPFTFGHGGAFGTQGWVDQHTKTIYVLLIQRAKMGNSDGSEVRRAFQQAAVDALDL